MRFSCNFDGSRTLSGVGAPNLATRVSHPVAIIHLTAGESRGGHHVGTVVAAEVGDGVVAEVGVGSAGGGAGAGVLQPAVGLVAIRFEMLQGEICVK